MNAETKHSGPVDVLAVLEDAARRIYVSAETQDDNDASDALLQARAAVAELVEASRVLLGEWDRQDSGNKFDPMPGKDWEAAEARFRAAVAAFGDMP